MSTPDPVPAPTNGRSTLSDWTSRKFISASFVQVVSAVALFVGKVDAGTWVAVSTLALSIYGATSVADKKLNPTQQ